VTSTTSLAEDVFSGLTWLASHATSLGVDPARIAVMGDSGGGCPTAGAAILARDRNVPLARQILVYRMLDDRNTAPDKVSAVAAPAGSTTSPARRAMADRARAVAII
jgi:acetyl esterase/lipase